MHSQIQTQKRAGKDQPLVHGRHETFCQKWKRIGKPNTNWEYTVKIEEWKEVKGTNPIISECRKLAQKECKTRHDCADRVIHWDLCQKLKSDHTNKLYMHKPESVLMNETLKLLWNFEIQTDHQISTRRPDLIIILKKKENLLNCGLCCPGEPQREIERMWNKG